MLVYWILFFLSLSSSCPLSSFEQHFTFSVPLQPQKSCHFSMEKTASPFGMSWTLVQQCSHCGHAGGARNGWDGLPEAAGVGWDTVLSFSFVVWSFGKSWMLFVLFSPLTEQRGDTVLADMRWNTNAAPSSGKLLILILKVQASGNRKKCFTMNSGSVLETCIIFLSMILSLILAGLIMFAHQGTFWCLYFPSWQGALLRP